MHAGLEIVVTDGECLLDSRLLARHLGYEHKIVLQSIRRHRGRLEARSILLQFEAKTTTDSKGRGRPEVYFMLNERQCLILTGSLKKGDEALEWHDALVDAFVQARARIRQLEAHIHHKEPPASIHTLSDALRPRALENLNAVPEGYFSVMGELFKHLYNLEAIINQALDDKAMIEISVGQHWSTYAREVLQIPETQRYKYAHRCQDGRVVGAWAYPIHYVNTFAKWLWQVYFPSHFPAYQQYRMRRLAQPSPKALPQRKRARR
jgi:phage regulator Rha-like protein